MRAPFNPPLHLAPLQQAMLQTSGHGHHVEQVEVIFAPSVMPAQVTLAWENTIAKTEALRLQFLQNGGAWHAVPFAGVIRELLAEKTVPECWETWRTADRGRPLLTPDSVPWRAVYLPAARRFIWTFHHALLDGRSITKVLKGFFDRIEGGNPETLKLSRWQPASVGKFISYDFADIPRQAREFSPDHDLPGFAVRHLGEAFLGRLKALAVSMEVTLPTLLTWSWGQALVRDREAPRVVVEQLRAGAPQAGAAGFTMNTLPVQIVKASREDAFENLQDFRKQLLALRDIENVSLDTIYNGNALDSSVIMVEHCTLAHELSHPLIESLALHEAKGEALGATAHILPDLRLEVEGPGRHRWLRAWIEVLEDQTGSPGLLA